MEAAQVRQSPAVAAPVDIMTKQQEDFTQYLKLINNCDSTDPLLSSTTLGLRLDQIALHQVDPADLATLTQTLNVTQLISTADGLARDYRGLAELSGFNTIEVETRFKRSYNPTKSIIDAYITRNLNQAADAPTSSPGRHQTTNGPVTVNHLLKMLESLERFDVIDDFLPTLVRLCNQSSSYSSCAAPSPSSSASHCPGKVVAATTNNEQLRIAANPVGGLVKNLDRLTVDDTSQSAIRYAAFICYAPQDFHHAQELMAFLDSRGKRVATADDLLPGHFEHDALVRLIDERCNKVLTILTPNFSHSRECEFQMKFASELSFQDRVPKIIPVVCEPCDYNSLPRTIQVLSKIDLTRGDPWQLNKLLGALGDPSDGLRSFNDTSSQFRAVQHHTTDEYSDRQLALASQAHSHSQARTPNEPIVDLLLSEQSYNVDHPSPENTAPNLTEQDHTERNDGWLKNIKRMVMRQMNSSPSTNSRSMLLTSTSSPVTPDLNADRCADIDGRG